MSICFGKVCLSYVAGFGGRVCFGVVCARLVLEGNLFISKLCEFQVFLQIEMH